MTEHEEVSRFWRETDKFEYAVLRYMLTQQAALADELERAAVRYTNIGSGLLPFDEINVLYSRVQSFREENSPKGYTNLFTKDMLSHRRVEHRSALLCEFLMIYAVYQNRICRRYETALRKAVQAADPDGKPFSFDRDTVIPLYNASLSEMLDINAAYYMKQLADTVLREQNPSMGTEITRNILKKARSDMLAVSKSNRLFGQLDRVYLYELGVRRVDELKRLGYRKVRFVAVLDNATTDVCRDLNGMKFDVDKLVVGKNAPPIYPPPHPCRSRLVGIK